jgi:hypothetical protein
VGLAELAWFAAGAWAGFAALRGKLTMAAGELVMSFVFAVLAGIVLANPRWLPPGPPRHHGLDVGRDLRHRER